MTVFESHLTPGNLKNFHIYITAILGHLTPTDVEAPPKAPGPIRLEFKDLKVKADIPKSRHGRPRKFIREPAFVKGFFERTGAVVGDTVLFEEIGPSQFRLSLRKAAAEPAEA